MVRGVWALACLAFVVLATLVPREAQAHPLGNFTINHFSRLEFTEDQARIDYVLDFAEIPTFQQKEKLDPNGNGKLSDAEARAYLDTKLPSLVENLDLKVGGENLPLRVLDSSAAYRPGQGGLPVLRVEAGLMADLPKSWESDGVGHYADRTYADHLGWREIVIRDGRGIATKDSTAPSSGVSDALRRYPQDMLSSPLDVRGARFTLVPGEGSAAGDTAASRGLSTSDYSFGSNGFVGRLYSRLNSLISFDNPSPTVILVSLLAALLWGAVHAFTPGHGKTVVAAYLIGDRGTAWHAAFLGLTVTLTHTVGVFALGGVAIYLSRYILPEALFPWLSVVSGLLVIAIGLSLLYNRWRTMPSADSRRARNAEPAHAHDAHSHDHSHALVGAAHSHGDHEHPYGHHDHSHEHAHPGHSHSHGDHEHSHGHHGHTHGGHTHSHLPPGADGSKVGLRSLVAIGVSGGLVPCPAALVLLLGAISLGRLGYGMVLVVLFSMGLAVVLTGIGLLMVYARRVFERYTFEARIPRLLPVASAAAISVVGLVILLGAISQTGLV